MTYKRKDLTQEVQALIEGRLERHEIVDPIVVVQELLAQWDPLPEHSDSEKYLLCSHLTIRGEVSSWIRRYRAYEEDEEQERQILLPGHKRLQEAYVTKRDGRQLVIPIEKMTREECEAKIEQLGSMRSGLTEHIEEFLRYVEEHFGPQ
jgi:hypothetical protein